MTTGIGLPASLIATLPGVAYTDPERFAIEQSVFFEMMWTAGPRVEELAQPGQFATLGIGQESVVVVRGRDGKLRAFLNICRHRGSTLCNEESGELGRNIRCPYHAWTYGLDGALVSAPNMSSMPDIDKAELGLFPVHLREWLGYVWLSLASTPPSFEDTVVAAVAERLGDSQTIDAWQMDALRLGHRVTYDVAANWKLIVENFMECYHCATIHPELTRILPEFRNGLATQVSVGHGALFGENIDGFTIDGRAGLKPIAGIGATQDRRYYGMTIWPQVFVNLVPDHVIVHRMFPLAADRTVIHCDWLFGEETLEKGTDIASSVALFHLVNEQDFLAGERCQPRMSSRIYASGGVLVPSEHHISRFHQWVASGLQANQAIISNP